MGEIEAQGKIMAALNPPVCDFGLPAIDFDLPGTDGTAPHAGQLPGAERLCW
jgi:hypothetical protein